MSFEDFNPKINWDSDEDDILNDFYKPALERTVCYQRLAGYFSSTAFVLILREIIDFIKKDSRMQLITSLSLSQQDIDTIEQSVENREKILSQNLLEKLQDDDEIIKKCVAIFGYMLSNIIHGKPQLEMKIAIPQTNLRKDDPNSIYHQKTGIMTDNKGRVITFSGSVNETGKAWIDNVEDFKVFQSEKDDTHRECVESDQKKFDKFWKNTAKRTSVYELPVAIQEHFLKARSKSNREFQEDVLAVEKFVRKPTRPKLVPWKCQERALAKIKEANYIGILKMATGTGKTPCAFLILEDFFENGKKFNNRVMILVPSGRDLVGGQWEQFFLKMKRSHDQVYLVSSDITTQERKDIAHVWKHGIGSNGNLFVIITIGSLKNFPFSSKFPDILIGDEVHEYGTEKRMDVIRNYLDQVKYRIGLSATPERFYDEEGTKRIFDFFGPIRFTYCIKDAQKEEKTPGSETVLSEYFYQLHLTFLTEGEESEVKELTDQIGQIVAIENDPTSSERESSLTDKIKNLLIQRSNILKTSKNKLIELRNILRNHSYALKNCLVYCEDIEQLDQVAAVFNEEGMDYVKYHYEVQEKEQSMDLFKSHQRDFILSIKCLDQGLDIPECKSLILLASSTNPREYIQRRGRVLRNFLNKPSVQIFDIPTFPRNYHKGYEGMTHARLLQIWEFIHASNSSEAKGKLISIRNQYNVTEEALMKEVESWCKSDQN